MSTSSPTIDSVLARTGQLYSLPAVANEVLRLTEQPRINAREIRDCLESDPALTAKLLRVVNSSLYGLPNEVSTLDQAIALVGVTPLRLLVLGFCLPEGLFENQTADALRRYWTETLTRATAARAIADAGWGRLGDSAFVAGMMQGIGQLVLLQQLGEDYAQVLTKFAESPTASSDDLAALELEALGFDHRTLSAQLLRQWNLPESLAVAIEHQTQPQKIGQLTTQDDRDEACLAQVVRLAGLLMELVAQRRLAVLPSLVDEGHAYCGMTRRQLNSHVEQLQAKVSQLAEAMSLPLESNIDYEQTMLDAHAQLVLASEQAAGQLISTTPTQDGVTADDEHLLYDLLGETRQLSHSMKRLLNSDKAEETRLPHAGRDQPRAPHHTVELTDQLAQALQPLVDQSRTRRESCSLVLMEVELAQQGTESSIQILKSWLDESPWAAELRGLSWTPLGKTRTAVVVPGLDRVDSTRLWSEIAVHLPESTFATLNAGVAGVAIVPNRFRCQGMIEAAERCLQAAIATAGSSIKGIEVY